MTRLPFTEVMAAKPLAQMCQTVTMPRKKGAVKGGQCVGEVRGIRGFQECQGQGACLHRLLALAPHLPSLQSPVLVF